RPVTSIRKIKDRNGALLFEQEKEDSEEDEEVLDPRIAYQITSILSDIDARPQEFWKTVLSVPGFQTAAKTGTSNKCLEREEGGRLPAGRQVCKLRKPDNVWTIGYTPMLVAGVWVGNADSSSLYEKADGLTVAAPIWKDFMTSAHKKMEITKTEFTAPEGLVSPQISLLSGQLPTECTPVELRRADLFRTEVAPKESDPSCLQLTIDKVTGLLASDECPVEAQETASFWSPRSVLADRWPLWQQGIDAWAAKEMEKWNATVDHSGSVLPLPVAPTEECKLSLTPGRMEKPKVSIDYPSQGDMVSYPSFQPELDWDVGSSIREIIFEVDGKVVDHMVEKPFKGFIRVPRSIKEEGSHQLKVTLVDEYYNQATDEVSFVFGKDESGPSIRLTAPEDGYTLKKGEEISIRAEAEDQGGIKHVQFYLDEILLSTKPKEPFELTYPMVTSPGAHTIRAVATDSTGNTEEDEVEIVVEE
ncbi:MAG TPA: Ig-like domain-containing protein, partial [Candidatus Peribacteraceae bacterium]|nr:Ig-like domain-containing protein [Candidatus Peribacteraceae bacterium]